MHTTQTATTYTTNKTVNMKNSHCKIDYDDTLQ